MFQTTRLLYLPISINIYEYKRKLSNSTWDLHNRRDRIIFKLNKKFYTQSISSFFFNPPNWHFITETCSLTNDRSQTDTKTDIKVHFFSSKCFMNQNKKFCVKAIANKFITKFLLFNVFNPLEIIEICLCPPEIRCY